MPYQRTWVDPDRYLYHRGVLVWHTYNDDYYDSPSTNYFTTDWDNADTDYHFDIRDQPEWTEAAVSNPGMSYYDLRHEALKLMIDKGVLIQDEHPAETRRELENTPVELP